MLRAGLAPVAFDEDITTVAVSPVPGNPDRVGAGWRNILTGNPDIVCAVPAMVSGVPCPVAVLRRWGRDPLNGTRWGWPDTDDDLCARRTCAQQQGACGNQELFLHSAISLSIE